MRECFGKIYPDLSVLEVNKELEGKVFSVRLVSQGMMRQSPLFYSNVAEWEECQRCEVYRSCFDFSTGKLLMRQALARL